MNRPPVRLEDLRIASPCPVSWETMTGDERVRHCRECGLNVYDISRLTRAEAERLVSTTEGRLCGRLFRRADGTVLTADCPVGWRAVKRRTARAAGAALTALLSLFTSGLGQTPAAKQKAEECRQQLTLQRVAAGQPPQPRKAAPLSGTILDPTGAIIVNSVITLTDEKTKQTRQAVSDEQGRYEFTALPAGSYTLTAEAAGFKSLTVPALELRAEETVRADATLLVSDVTNAVLVGIIDSGIRYEAYDRDKPVLRVNGQIIRYED